MSFFQVHSDGTERQLSAQELSDLFRDWILNPCGPGTILVRGVEQ